MHRLFLGCNLWSALFLCAALWLGWTGSEHHIRAGIFAAVFACLIQSGIIALFLGAAKLIKEHVGRFQLPPTLIDRLNEVYHRLVPSAALGAVSMVAVAITGGLADLGRLPRWAHHLPAVASSLYLLGVVPYQYLLQRRLHAVIDDVGRLLPQAGREPAARSGTPAADEQGGSWIRGRGRALLYIGMTAPLPYLGYTYIAGRDLEFLRLPTLVLTVGCLAGAAASFLARRRSSSR